MSQLCADPSCNGRTKAGGRFCRLCGQPLPADWRARAWSEEGIGEWDDAVAVRELPLDGGDCQLFGGAPWLGCRVGTRTVLLEPGRALREVGEVAFEPGELAVDLVPKERMAPFSPGGGAEWGWSLLTSRRVMGFVPRENRWVVEEEFSHQDGELLWQRGALRAFQRDGGAVIIRGRRGEVALEVAGSLTEPAWVHDKEVAVAARSSAFLVDAFAATPPVEIALPEELPGYAPAFVSAMERLFLSTLNRVYWWTRAGGRLVPFLPTGGAGLASSLSSLVVAEPDRIRLMRPDGRVLWDSQRKMPDLARTRHPWDRAGDIFVVAMQTSRGAGSLLALDLSTPEEYLLYDVGGSVLSPPRLVPGGVVVLRGGAVAAKGSGELLWIERRRRTETEE